MLPLKQKRKEEGRENSHHFTHLARVKFQLKGKNDNKGKKGFHAGRKKWSKKLGIG